MKKIFLILACCFLASCSLRHVSEIRRVQAAGANADEQKKYVREVNANFEKLLAATRSGEISQYTTQEDFLKTFGPPIFEKKAGINQDYAMLWLYRYCEKMKGSEKVYLYFDSSRKLLKWEHIPAPEK